MKTNLQVEVMVTAEPNLVLLQVLEYFVRHKTAEERINAMDRKSVRKQATKRWNE